MRQPPCGRPEARARARLARGYLDTATLVADADSGLPRNVAAGNAVLAGIAASDALCCLRLGRRSRDSDHRAAVDLLTRVDPALGRHLSRLLQAKDLAHYGTETVTAERITALLRAASVLVEAAEQALDADG